jgi:hypothetical protein
MRLVVLLVLVGAVALPATARAGAPPVTASAYVIEDARTGEVLASSNAHAHLPIASITKLMTVLLTLEHHKLTDVVTVDPRAASVNESSIDLSPGEQLTVRDLLKGALIQSANDAADALALSIAPDYPAFARLMNAKAVQLGLRDSNFVRPDGLDAPGEYSSAADVTRLARLVMRTRFVRETVREETDTIAGGRTLHTWDDLLQQFPATIGVKTGHTDDAGWCQVAAGCSPTTMIRARAGPSPNTVWVPSLYKGHPRHPFDAARSFGTVGRGGMKSAAEPVGFTVLFGWVVLLAVFGEAVPAGLGLAELIEVVRALRRGLLVRVGMTPLQVLDDRRVCLIAVLAFRVRLRALRPIVLLRHRSPPELVIWLQRNRRNALRIALSGKRRATVVRPTSPSGSACSCRHRSLSLHSRSPRRSRRGGPLRSVTRQAWQAWPACLACRQCRCFRSAFHCRGWVRGPPGCPTCRPCSPRTGRPRVGR